ncbi:MAG: PAS-domain containing protein [Rhodobacteraceae bacterium]|nr:PAS-domain containing protein [Paracoccaceae bacterium]
MTMGHHETDEMMLAGLNLIQQAFSIFDSELILVHSNLRMKTMFDLPDRLVAPGATFEDVIRYLVEAGEYGPVDNIDASVQARVTLAQTFEPHYMERTRPNGRVISVEGAPLPQGGWVTVYTDITHTKRQEALLQAHSEELSDQLASYSEELSASNRMLESTISALEEAKRQLTESEARTRLTTEMMPAHIAHVDRHGRYTFSNRQLSAVIPGRPSDIVGLAIDKALGDDAYQKVKPHLHAARQGRQSTFEFTHTPSSRRIRSVFTPDESREGAYILSMDVTEETQARAALQQTRRREVAAQLTSGLAHDFSNLLTIILGMQSKLASQVTDPDASELVNGTIAAARRGGTLLNRIADMTSRRGYRPEPVNLRVFLDELNTLATPSLPDALHLDIHCAEAGPVLLDTGLLQDSLLNLILNARDACGSSGTIRIEVRFVQEIWIEFLVTDTGDGFSVEALANGLDPFFTTKGGEGSGLGLTMVYDMAKMAGGETRLFNTAHGACVALRLPLRRARPHPPGLVLLVEDSPDLRASVRDMLITAGNTVVEASSVDEAKGLARTLPGISLVFSDIQLEGEATGLDLIEALPDRRVLLMTSLAPDDPLFTQARARTPVLGKPFTATELTAFLAQEPPHK